MAGVGAAGAVEGFGVGWFTGDCAGGAGFGVGWFAGAGLEGHMPWFMKKVWLPAHTANQKIMDVGKEKQDLTLQWK